LFGTTFGIGIQNRAPKKGERPVTMHHGDIVNLIDITAADENQAANRIQEFVASQGIDFIFDSSTRSLKIQA
jgi:hypothetical protein